MSKLMMFFAWLLWNAMYIQRASVFADGFEGHSYHSELVKCDFETTTCDFEIVEPDPSEEHGEEDVFYWFKQESFTLSNGETVSDHTKSSSTKDGTLLFANGGRSHSLTIAETATPIECTAQLCCFNAYALMSQSTGGDSNGSLALYIIQDSFGPNPVSTILANVSFDSYKDHWTNIQRTFSPNDHPFRIGVEARNGDGGREFFVAVDDIAVTTGMCESDERVYGGNAGTCNSPPAVIGGEVSLTSDTYYMHPGTQVTYSCKLGYDIVGQATSTCLLNGQWSSSPICSPFRTSSYYRTPKNEQGEALDLPPGVFYEQMTVDKDPLSPLVTNCVWGEDFEEGRPTSDLSSINTSLTLFPDNPIMCSGKIIRWSFLTPVVADGTGLYLSIWRPDDNGKFRLVGFNQFTTKKDSKLVQYVVAGNKRIQVQSGDIIGVLHKATATEGAIFVQDLSQPQRASVSAMGYSSVSANYFIEDVRTGMTINVNMAARRKYKPILQVFIGESECTENILVSVSFKGVNARVPGVTTQQGCFDYCRQQPACSTITYDTKSKDCRYYSYISSEVHDSSIGQNSLVKACEYDCDLNMVSDGSSFDIAFQGRKIQLETVPQSIDDCELRCRYNPDCAGITYQNPFEVGSCVHFSNITSLESVSRSRSFRKWGCYNVRRVENCQPCSESYQCKGNATCLSYGSEGSKRCTPRNPSDCEPKLLAPPRKLCPNPPEIEKGRVADYNEGSSPPNAVYACNSGFELVGGDSVSCTNGSWQLPLPVCRPLCGELPSIKNGRLQVLTSSKEKQLLVVCYRGFELMGNQMVVCTSSGTWSAVPQCIATCGNPPVVANARMLVVQGTPTIPTSVRYECNVGFALDGIATVQCIHGLWEPLLPLCNTISQCPDPPPLANGAVLNSESGLKNGSTYLSKATYKCMDGYTLFGNATIFCRGQSTWDSLPACTSFCSPIPTVENARAKVLASSNGQPFIVQYECIGDLKMYGDAIISCISSLWTPAPPRCIAGRTPNHCGLPPSITDGFWRPQLYIEEVPVSVQYFCNKGFHLMGPACLVCAFSGRGVFWQPAALPFCQPATMAMQPLFIPFFVPLGFPPTNVDSIANRQGVEITVSKPPSPVVGGSSHFSSVRAGGLSDVNAVVAGALQNSHSANSGFSFFGPMSPSAPVRGNAMSSVQLQSGTFNMPQQLGGYNMPFNYFGFTMPMPFFGRR